MSRIDPQLLAKAMNGAGVTTAHIASQTGITIQYANDIVKGRRNLARNPDLRKRIAAVCNVPTFWIEAQS